MQVKERRYNGGPKIAYETNVRVDDEVISVSELSYSRETVCCIVTKKKSQ